MRVCRGHGSALLGRHQCYGGHGARSILPMILDATYKGDRPEPGLVYVLRTVYDASALASAALGLNVNGTRTTAGVSYAAPAAIT